MKPNVRYRLWSTVGLLALVGSTAPRSARAQEESPEPVETSSTAVRPMPLLGDVDIPPPETITILGRQYDKGRVAGSAHRVSAETLRDFEYDDIQRVLTKIPGVYIRDEDGFGLRPNIGLRGANSDRSSRVVLMEDGILLGPAPYSAPAAYFLPLPTRMEGVEVFKGPASVQYGPFTVGGAINLQTAEIPDGHAVFADLAGGQFGYGKLHGRYGWGGEHVGFLIEGVHLQSTGFKELDFDDDADTGFAKNEVMLKARFNSSPTDSIYHRFDVKLGYADEGSNETYFGITDDDFEETPLRRYRGSQLARMEWERTQVQLSYTLTAHDDFTLKVAAYRHDFTRAWLKLNRFRTLSGAVTTPVDDVLTDPTGNNELLLAMARGEVSSESIFSQASVPSFLGIGTNDRTFVSQGVQADGEYYLSGVTVDHRFRFGARVHYDEIKRRHDEAAYAMVVADGEPSQVVRESDIEPILTNDESSVAIALYARDELTILDDLTLTPGLRSEIIFTRSDRERSDNLEQTRTLTNDTVVFIPGLGAHYDLGGGFGVLAGVHRGFSPVAPGQFDDIEPELSWNYEGGLRYSRGLNRAEVIGFFSDYTNLLLNCTFSAGCPPEQIGQQFNAGDAFVYGMEAGLHHEMTIGSQVRFMVDAAYTLTLSELRSSFTSGSPQYETVTEGDRLPYVPIHQASVLMGVTGPVFGAPTGLRVSYTFVDRMRNEASQGDVPDADLTDAQHVVDATAHVEFGYGTRLYARIDNLLNQTFIASRRPFGARPGKPFQFQLGFSVRWDEDG